MIVYEAKLKGTKTQYQLLDEAIKAGQFIRNKALRCWIDNQKVKRSDLLKLCTDLRRQFSWCRKLSAQACQSSADRAWTAISRYYRNYHQEIFRKKDYPRFKKNSRSIEYKVDGWKLSDDRRQISFRDGFRAGEFRLIGTRNLHFYQKEEIKRVRVIRRSDGYYCQFCIDCNRTEKHSWTGRTIGICRRGEYLFIDSDGNKVEFLDSLPKSYRACKREQRRMSRKLKFSKNRVKAKRRLGKANLKLSRRRIDWACKTARALVKSADLIVYEDLENTKAQFCTSNHKLAHTIGKQEWREFLRWLKYFAKIHGILIVAVPPELKKREDSEYKTRKEEERNTENFRYSGGKKHLNGDREIAKMILARGLSFLGEKQAEIARLLNTVGRTEINACGDLNR